ncbi:D-lactate dehydrogenase [Venturia nashicola]|uniref:D-lactate dehydrogenase n=1 Tax=Venturia nashicola TaxID=86259 RepID=A0A4Z1NNZ1_9PEZI|nr:D-lactate dehydrogenase [Venturia nashicola]TLD26205.1 D-lactate dehydrogenase [Venturia nashicola]
MKIISLSAVLLALSNTVAGVAYICFMGLPDDFPAGHCVVFDDQGYQTGQQACRGLNSCKENGHKCTMNHYKDKYNNLYANCDGNTKN